MFIKHPNDRPGPMHPAEREDFYKELNTPKKGKKVAAIEEPEEEETETEEEVEAPVRTPKTAAQKTAAQKKAAAKKKAAKK